jgi:hypothetical protein
MKYIIILFLLFVGNLNGQKSYPYLYSDSVGSQFIVLTFEQAQKLDNATEFSPTFWKDVNKYYVHVDSLCKIELLEKNRQIDSLNLENKKLAEISELIYSSVSIRDSIIKNKNQMIKNLEYQNSLEKTDFETKLNVKEKEIKSKKRDIKYLGGFSIILMIGVVISTIF